LLDVGKRGDNIIQEWHALFLDAKCHGSISAERALRTVLVACYYGFAGVRAYQLDNKNKPSYEQ
jgi:hypothetical protein